MSRIPPAALARQMANALAGMTQDQWHPGLGSKKRSPPPDLELPSACGSEKKVVVVEDDQPKKAQEAQTSIDEPWAVDDDEAQPAQGQASR